MKLEKHSHKYLPPSTPDSLPPHSIEAEQGLIACCVLDPAACLPEAIKALPGRDIFYDLRHQRIFDTLVKMQQDGKPISPVTLALRLKADGAIEAVGGQAYVMELQEATHSASFLPSFIESVTTAHAQRLWLRVCHHATQTILAPGATIEKIRDAAETSLASFTGNAGHDPGQLDLLRWSYDNQPPTVPPVFTLNGIAIATPGNLQTICAAAKAGKSAFVNGMLAATMATDDARDTFGIRSANPKGFAVIHFDTEQSRLDHWKGITRAMHRAGLSEPPPWLQSYSLAGKSFRECQRILEYALEHGANQFGGIHSASIDGTADMVADVNDPEESNEFVARLHGHAITYNCSIGNIIHLNPGTEKSRGHLGSQLERKSETNLRLDKEGEATEVWGEKQRGAPIPKGTGPRFAWSDEFGMHVSVQTAQSARRDAKAQEELPLAEDVFGTKSVMRYAELERAIVTTKNTSESKAKRLINKWQELGILVKGPAGIYTLKA